MITIRPIELENIQFTGIKVELPKTNLLVVTNEIGYIMCAALDINLINDVLSDREVVAGRAVGVRSLEQLIEAPLEGITDTARTYGWKEGMTGKEALLKIG